MKLDYNIGDGDGTISVATYTGEAASDTVHYCQSICRYCGGGHNEEHCPRVKEIRYRKNGRVKWVKLHEPISLPFYYPYWIIPVNVPSCPPPYKWV